jgi:hypothetical protein
MMAKFLYLYSGGQIAETPEAQEESMQVWTSWFGSLGDSVVDMGNPFSTSSTVTAGGASDGGTSKLSGYSIVNAESLAEAAQKADGCPVLQSGGSVEVYEAVPMRPSDRPNPGATAAELRAAITPAEFDRLKAAALA